MNGEQLGIFQVTVKKKKMFVRLEFKYLNNY